MSEDKLKINKFINYMKSKNGAGNPIKNHILEKEEDYNKNLYLKMLCVVMQYSDNITEEQTSFVQRLTIGVGAESDIKDYMRQALEIDEKDYDEFINQVKDNDLKYMFAIDTLLIAHLGVCDDDYKKFIAAVVQALGITYEEFKYISDIIITILEQDKDKFSELDFKEKFVQKNKIYKRELFLPYIELIGKIQQYKDDKLTVISLPKLGQVQLEKDITILEKNNTSLKNTEGELYKYGAELTGVKDTNVYVNNNKVVFKNLEIALESMLIFSDCNYVELVGCKIIGGSNSVYINNCKNVKITDCLFTGFNSTILIMNDVNIEIVKCIFEKNKASTYNDDGWGKSRISSILNEAGVNNMDIIDTKFKDIYCDDDFVDRGSLICNASLANITNCTFENCRIKDLGLTNDASTSPRDNNDPTLFNSSIIGVKNKLTNSVHFKHKR